MGLVSEETGFLFLCGVETYCRRGRYDLVCISEAGGQSEAAPFYHPCGLSLHGHWEPLCPISAEGTQKSKGREGVCQLNHALFKQLFSETPPRNFLQFIG